jgi:hypothetical protein
MLMPNLKLVSHADALRSLVFRRRLKNASTALLNSDIRTVVDCERNHSNAFAKI